MVNELLILDRLNLLLDLGEEPVLDTFRHRSLCELFLRGLARVFCDQGLSLCMYTVSSMIVERIPCVDKIPGLLLLLTERVDVRDRGQGSKTNVGVARLQLLPLVLRLLLRLGGCLLPTRLFLLLLGFLLF